MMTKDQLHQLVEALPESMVPTAAQVLEGLRRLGTEPPGDGLAAGNDQPRRAVFATEELRRLGPPTAVVAAPPIASIDELASDFWPPDENPDEFTATIRRWREADRLFDAED